jgi:hypothetical protein
VTLDTSNHYLSTLRSPADGLNYQVFAFLSGDVQPNLYLNGIGDPISDFSVQSSRGATGDTMTYWATDLTNSDWFLTSVALTRPSDTMQWQNDISCPTFRPSRGHPRGFDIRGDGMLAVAVDDGGIVIYDTDRCRMSDTVDTPGIAYSCAWNGDYVVVADEYFVTIVDASDPDNVTVAGSLDVPGASRLRKVVVDGSYAALSDDYDGIYVVDISNPHAPQYVQLLSLEDPTAVAALNGRIYVTDRALGLVIYAR